MNLSPIIQFFLSSPFFLALVISLAAIPLLKRPAKFLGLVDHPGGRKKHQTTAVLVGGPAIILSCSISIFIFGLPDGYEGMAYATLGLFFIGMLDDKFDLSARFRLVTQALLVSIALWVDGTWITDIAMFDNIILELGAFKYPLTILAILGVMNAINMLDGVDGLSSGVVLIILGFMVSSSIISSSAQIESIGTILIGAVLGFWLYNYRFSWREETSAFMGDSGTTILGFLLPYLAIKLSAADPVVAPKSLMLWFFAIPIWDICAVVVKRLKEGKSPMLAGRDHIHHVLMNSGLSVRQTIHLIYLLCITTASFGITILYFGFAQLEVYAIYIFSMLIYLGRVGGLSKKGGAEVINLDTNDQDDKPSSTVVKISSSQRN